jgi:hypothetical protein
MSPRWPITQSTAVQPTGKTAHRAIAGKRRRTLRTNQKSAAVQRPYIVIAAR